MLSFHPLSSTVVYFSALVLTLSQQMTSDRINLYPTSNSTLWWATLASPSSTLDGLSYCDQHVSSVAASEMLYRIQQVLGGVMLDQTECVPVCLNSAVTFKIFIKMKALFCKISTHFLKI